MFNKSLKQELAVTRQDRDSYLQDLAAMKHHLPSIEFDPEGTVLKANSAFVDIVGYSERELIGQHPIVCFVNPLTQNRMPAKDFGRT